VAIIAEENEKKMDKWKLVPPDGGWGWLVLFGSTLVNVLIPGTIKSFGVLFAAFIDDFNTSSADAAAIPGICYFLYSSLGSTPDREFWTVTEWLFQVRYPASCL
jgi:hypothetical protein